MKQARTNHQPPGRLIEIRTRQLPEGPLPPGFQLFAYATLVRDRRLRGDVSQGIGFAMGESAEAVERQLFAKLAPLYSLPLELTEVIAMVCPAAFLAAAAASQE